jgi:hypothetical protein
MAVGAIVSGKAMLVVASKRSGGVRRGRVVDAQATERPSGDAPRSAAAGSGSGASPWD